MPTLTEILLILLNLIPYGHMRVYMGKANATMEPPDCMYNMNLSELGQTLVVDSSYPNSTYNYPGECQLNIQNMRYEEFGLLYSFHQLGPYINDCSVEIQFYNIRDDLNEARFLEIYDCDNLHQNRHGRSQSEYTLITVRRSYVTLRRDFFFKLNITMVRTRDIFVQRTDEVTAIILYCLVVLNFMIPTSIFFINECIKKRRPPELEDETPDNTVFDQDPNFSQAGKADNVTPVNSAAVSLKSGMGQREGLKSADKQLQLFPFYKKLDKLQVTGRPTNGLTRSYSSRADSKNSTIDRAGSDRSG